MQSRIFFPISDYVWVCRHMYASKSQPLTGTVMYWTALPSRVESFSSSCFSMVLLCLLTCQVGLMPWSLREQACTLYTNITKHKVTVKKSQLIHVCIHKPAYPHLYLHHCTKNMLRGEVRIRAGPTGSPWKFKRDATKLQVDSFNDPQYVSSIAWACLSLIRQLPADSSSGWSLQNVCQGVSIISSKNKEQHLISWGLRC